MAQRYMAGQRADPHLAPPPWVNEAYMRLVGFGQVRWQDRAHFLGVSPN